MPTHKQLQIAAQGAPFNVATVETPTPEADEVSIAVSAAAINPLDYKQQYYGTNIAKWPTVIGAEAAGKIIAVGSAVSEYAVGSDVIVLTTGAAKGGAYQSIITQKADKVALAPKSIDAVQAASLPVAFGTAAAVVYAYPEGLGLPLGFLDGEDLTPRRPDVKSVLLLGGSSTVGGSTIQLLRSSPAWHSGANQIFFTSSPQHHARLRGLGADAGFDQRSASLVEDVKKASAGGRGVDAIVDLVGALRDDQAILGALRPDGPKVVSVLVTGPPVPLPDTVDGDQTGLYFIYSRPGGASFFRKLAGLVDEGKFRIPYEVVTAGTSLEDVPAAVERIRAGVSGQKLVVKY